MFTNKYKIKIGKYSKNHYIKDFMKKHKNHWMVTYKSIFATLERIESFMKTDKIDEICSNDNICILKGNFSIAGRKQSPKVSGNRYIVFMNKKERFCKILLLYHKGNIPKKQRETAWWKQEIKNNYIEIQENFDL